MPTVATPASWSASTAPCREAAFAVGEPFQLLASSTSSHHVRPADPLTAFCAICREFFAPCQP